MENILKQVTASPIEHAKEYFIEAEVAVARAVVYAKRAVAWLDECGELPDETESDRIFSEAAEDLKKFSRALESFMTARQPYPTSKLTGRGVCWVDAFRIFQDPEKEVEDANL